MKILNLYAGIGGNRNKWTDCCVTAVEEAPYICAAYKKLYPSDIVICDDAHKYLIENLNSYDFIWSSPPCQTHSKSRMALPNLLKYPDMKLYEEIILLKHFCKGLWCVENVKSYYNYLIKPTQYIGRHCFWSNFNISSYNKTYTSGIQKMTANKLMISLNLPIPHGTKNIRQLLRNAVNPEIGLHILNDAMKEKERKVLGGSNENNHNKQYKI